MHSNPVKHGLVDRVKEWLYSTFHHYVRTGVYAEDWDGGDYAGIGGWCMLKVFELVSGAHPTWLLP